jgi:hypothetical protein
MFSRRYAKTQTIQSPASAPAIALLRLRFGLTLQGLHSLGKQVRERNLILPRL